MKDIPQITEAELEIMKILWEENPLSANEIISLLSDEISWSDQTIKTFLNRLLNKHAIRHEKSGRSYLYYPVVSYDEYVEVENKSFLQRVYDGALGMLFSKFLEEENLSDKEIEHLQSLLEQKKKSQKKRKKSRP